MLSLLHRFLVFMELETLQNLKRALLPLKKERNISRNKLLLKFVGNLYSRSDEAFERGNFRVRGDTIDLYLAYTDYAIDLNFGAMK